MNNQYANTVDFIYDLIRHNHMYFPDALNFNNCQLWGCCVSPTFEIWVMDDYREWHKLDQDHLSDMLLVIELHKYLVKHLGGLMPTDPKATAPKEQKPNWFYNMICSCLIWIINLFLEADEKREALKQHSIQSSEWIGWGGMVNNNN